MQYTLHPLYDNFGRKIDKEVALKELKLSSDYQYLLFFGFIRDYKGLDLLLDAMANPLLKNMPVKLIIAGEFYANKEKYLQQIADLHIADKIVLHTEFIPNTKVSTYFSAADLIVQPYKSATQSGVTQVAYHFEKPIITTNVGALAEIVPDGKVGYVVAPESEAIAKAIYRFFSENQYQNFHLAMREEKKKFDWNVMIDVISEIEKNC